MRILTAMVLTVMPAVLAESASLPVVLRDGRPHVAALDLEREAGIAIKRLPGGGGFVACSAGRCAALKSVVVDGETLLVSVADLGAAMNLTSSFDAAAQEVAIGEGTPAFSAPEGVAQVGTIAPNLRLTMLDGTSVTLDEFRGRRVLINSWASW